MTSSSASAPRLGLIGRPVSHSLSPRIFKELAERLGRPVRYDAVDLAPAELSTAFEMLKADYRGLNVTIPHKQAVIPLLAKLSEEAKAIGAVNAVRFSPAGAEGHNTDAGGFLDALTALDFDPQGRDAVVFGAGGAARAAAWALGKAGASLVRICGRDPGKAAALSRELANHFPKTGYTAGQPRAAELWVNATPLGMAGFPDETPFAGKALCGRAFDLVYGRKTAFLREAERAGAPAADGLDMLVAQALRAWEFWFAPIGARERLLIRCDLRGLLSHA